MRHSIFFMRKPYERCVLELEGNTILWTCQKWRQVVGGREDYPDAEKARERFQEMQMIVALDYRFTAFMENFDQ